MKAITVVGLLAVVLLATACASKSDLKAVSDRVDKVQVGLDCEGDILETFIMYGQLQSAMAQEGADPMAALQIQMQLQVLQAKAKVECTKFDALNAADKKAASEAK